MKKIDTKDFDKRNLSELKKDISDFVKKNNVEVINVETVLANNQYVTRLWYQEN